jgi:hypothetical protein
MARTDRFRHEHDELLSLAHELQALLDPQTLTTHGSAARSCLGKLMGKLVLHLTIEDKVLYPKLAACGDAAVAGLALKFLDEMKTTTVDVLAYNQRWARVSAIKANPAAFIDETRQVIKVLADRIDRENHELYAAADRLEGAAFA